MREEGRKETAQEGQVQEQHLKYIEELKFQKKVIRNLIILQVILTITLFILVLKKYQIILEINNILIELESLFFRFNH